MESLKFIEDVDVSKGVKSFDELSKILFFRRKEKLKVVLCHGVFDLLHVGHIRYLKRSKKFGDLLVVTVTPDEYVNKGPNRPAFSENLRVEAISALEFVDYVAINKWPMAVETIKNLQPDFYVKGKDYSDEKGDKTGGILLERETIESINGKFVIVEEMTFSSSSLMNKYLPLCPPKMNKFLKEFSKKYSYKEIEAYIENLASLKVLLVGEAVIDDCQYCRTMGKSGDDPVLCVSYERNEMFIGGGLAIANHVAEFCKESALVTFLGSEKSYDSFIKERLNPKIQAHFLEMSKGTSTIVKRRFVEEGSFQKLFEVYTIDEDEENPNDSEKLCKKLEKLVPNYDVVIVADYGHAMMNTDAISLLEKRAKFLAVYTQINSGNQLFNTMLKYSKADFICISEDEIRIDTRRKKGSIKSIIEEVSTKLEGAKIVVTRGEEGIVCYDPKSGFSYIPDLVGKKVSRDDSGGAVLALASLCVKKNIPMDVVGLVANFVGIQGMRVVGNRMVRDKISLLRSLEHSLK